MAKSTKQRPLTPDDLKSLVQALGQLVRESVREEVRDQLAPFAGVVANLNGAQMVTTALDRNRERVIGDMKRDYEHRVYLGEIDAARHPERFGASSKEIADARAANLAAAVRYEAKHGNLPDEPPLPMLIDAEVKR